jgi:hypothetical protein
VLPAAVLGFLIAYPASGILVQAANALGVVHPPSDDSFANRFARYLLWYLPMSIAFVAAGSLVAPLRRVLVALVLSGIWLAWAVTVHGWQQETAIAASVGVAGGIVVVLMVLKAPRPAALGAGESVTSLPTSTLEK